MGNPILQFGTSRFLQAHVDLFVDEALAAGQALGPITVVQTSASPASLRRVAAFGAPGGYPVRLRGLSDGRAIDVERRVGAVSAAYRADTDWTRIRADVAGPVEVIVSNTGDAGYALADQDHPGLIDGATAPRSFPAKLLVLLHHRYRAGGRPLTLFPCELVANNGSVLRDIVLGLATHWRLGGAFADYLRTRCVWVNSLVDRIVSEPIEPVGAVAEPYALWVIERQPGMTLPCRHPQIVVTDSLAPFERRKLLLLNLGHTCLAEHWLRAGGPAGATVLDAMRDAGPRAQLESVWSDEVLPVFDALGEGDSSRRYLAEVRERFCNPFLEHRLADIADNHAEKKRRRLLPVLALADQLGLRLAQPRLRAAVEGQVQ